MDETTPRRLPERTGRHLCTRCLGEVVPEDYFANDHLCNRCAEDGDYPLQLIPGAETQSAASRNGTK